MDLTDRSKPAKRLQLRVRLITEGAKQARPQSQTDPLHHDFGCNFKHIVLPSG